MIRCCHKGYVHVPHSRHECYECAHCLVEYAFTVVTVSESNQTALPSLQIRDLVPESQAYMDLLAFERKLDSTIMRKRLEIQEVIRRPMKQKRKLRVFISHQFSTMEPEDAVGARTLGFSWRPSHEFHAFL